MAIMTQEKLNHFAATAVANQQRLSGHDEAILLALHRVDLRHPGMLTGQIRRLLKRSRFTEPQLWTLRQEYRRLGLDATGAVKHEDAKIRMNGDI